MKKYIFESDRLGFRAWEDQDSEYFIAMARGIEGKNFFSRTYDKYEALYKMAQYRHYLTEHGYGFWVIEDKFTHEFIGFLGFNEPSIKAFFTPCIQMAWCIKQKFWGKGYATEGAKRAIEYIRRKISPIQKFYAYSLKYNKRSIQVMHKIGMTYVDELYIEDDCYEVYTMSLDGRT